MGRFMYKNIIIVGLILIISVMGIFFIYYFQQNQTTMKELKKSQKEDGRDGMDQIQITQQIGTLEPKIFENNIKAKEVDIKNSTKEIVGEIKQVSNSFFIISAKIIDFSALNTNSKELIMLKKDYKVMVSEKTYYTNKKNSDFKVMDRIQAFSSDPVYDVNEFIAIEINNLSVLPSVNSNGQ